MLPLQSVQNLSHLVDEAITSLDQIDLSCVVVEGAEEKNPGFGEPYKKVQKLYDSVEKDCPKEFDHVKEMLSWTIFIQTHYQSSWFLIEFGKREQRLEEEIRTYRNYLNELKWKIVQLGTDSEEKFVAPAKSPITESFRSNSADTPST